MMMRVAVAVAMVFCASFAHADKRSEAKKYFRAGERAFNAGQYGAAAQAFEESYSRVPLPAIAFSTAQALRLQYTVDKDPARLKRAVELYRSYLEAVRQGGRRTDAVDALSRLEPLLAQQGDAPTVTKVAEYKLLITTEAAKATVSLNGSAKTPMPLSAVVKPGKYSVIIEAPGYHPKTESFEVFEGQRFKLIEAELGSKPAMVALDVEDGAVVYVDGLRVATTPLSAPLELRHGKHVVSVSRRGRYSFASEVSLKRGQRRDLRPNLKTTFQRKVAWTVWGGTAVAVLAAGGTAAIALSAQTRASDIDRRRLTTGISQSELEDYDRARERRDVFRSLSTGLGISAAVLGAAGLALYIFDHPGLADANVGLGSAVTAASVVPVLGPRSVGVGLTSRF